MNTTPEEIDHIATISSMIIETASGRD